MSDLSLQERIQQAQQVLVAAFGADQKDQLQGFDVYKYLTEDGLAQAYMSDAGRIDVTNQLMEISKSIRNMRSSFLPLGFFLDELDSDSLISSIQGTLAKKEPYENAFMRMLGMPAVSDFQYGVTREYTNVNTSDIFLVIDPISGELIEQDFSLVKENIIEQRRRTGRERRFVINNSFYDIRRESSVSFIEDDVISIASLNTEQKANLLSLNYEDGLVYYIDQNGTRIEVNLSGINEISRAPGTTEPFKNPITGQDIQNENILTAPLSDDVVDPNAADVSIATLSNDLCKFYYLLVPPIQDPEIANAVNETEKIVIPPFSSPIFKKVNSHSPRPSLLESVIRIRLDRITGSSSRFAQDTGAEVLSSVDGTQPTSDDYGILEALFIVRLRSAILGLSNKMVHDIDVMIEEMEKCRRYPQGENPESEEDVPRNIAAGLTFSVGDEVEEPEVSPDQNVQTEDAAQNDEVAEDADEGDEDQNIEEVQAGELTQSTLINLQNQKLIEDSIMFLLANNAEVLDLQEQTQRSSSMRDSHMMSGLINIIDIPRKRINEEIKKIKDQRNEAGSTILEEKAKEVGAVLGMDIGIGTLDLTVFSLALFTLSEDSLLGLLSEAQFERMKNGDFKGVIPPDITKKDVVSSINELTYLIYEGYNLFRSGLDTAERLEQVEPIPAPAPRRSTPIVTNSNPVAPPAQSPISTEVNFVEVAGEGEGYDSFGNIIPLP